MCSIHKFEVIVTCILLLVHRETSGEDYDAQIWRGKR